MAKNIVGQIDLYSDTAFDVIEAINAYSIGNITIDDHNDCKRYHGHRFKTLLRGAILKRGNTNNIILESEYSYYMKENSSKMKSRIALELKNSMVEILNQPFDKTDETKHVFIYKNQDHQDIEVSFSCKDVACIYDLLMGHTKETLKRIYGNTFVDSIVGKPLNPFIAEQMAVYEEEIVNIEHKKDEDLAKLSEENQNKINDFNEENKVQVKNINIKYNEQIDKIRDLYLKNLA